MQQIIAVNNRQNAPTLNRERRFTSWSPLRAAAYRLKQKERYEKAEWESNISNDPFEAPITVGARRANGLYDVLVLAKVLSLGTLTLGTADDPPP